LTAGIVSSILGMILLFMTTVEAVVYGYIGWFTYVVLYTFWSKRKYTLNTVIGSVSGDVTPLIGWDVITSAYHVVPILLSLMLFVCQITHHFVISMLRYDEYKAANVPMLPFVYGFDMTKRQMAVYVLCLLPLPFFLTSLGAFFVSVITVLNIAWSAIAVKGVFSKENKKYANTMFYF